MKKHLFILLVISVFTTASAQSYTQAFDSVFRHVDLSHTSTGILCERGLPPEGLPTNCSWVNNKVVSKTDTADTQYYKHSVGINIGWFDGVCYRVNIVNNLFFQADVGMGLFLNFCALPICPDIVCDLGSQLYFLYERKFPKRTNTYWIAGGGLSIAAVSPVGDTKKINTLKAGPKVLLGIEFFPGGKVPLSIQVDARFGYNVMYSPKDSYRGVFIPNVNPYHYFDYGFVFSVRYHFGKKN